MPGLPLSGIIAPMATPLLGPDRLDHAGCDRLLDHMLAAGIAGVFILGTTGEAPGLSYRLRGELIDHICSAAGGRVAVLVGVTDTSAVETIRMAERGARAGASAVVLAPPFYFGLTQPELAGYLERIVPALPLPVFLYNIPSLTGAEIAPETVRRAAAMDQIAGLKDSSGDLDYFRRVIEAVSHRRDFAVFCGPEELLGEAMRLGASGGVTGGANLFPELYVDIYTSSLRNDRQRVDRLQQIVDTVSRGVYNLTRDPSSYLRGMKCALAALGVCGNVLAEPYVPFGGGEAAAVGRTVLEIQHRLEQLEVRAVPLST